MFGVALAKWALRGYRLPPAIAGILVLVGFVSILIAPMISENTRVLNWGIPAFAIVAGAVSLEPLVAGRTPALAADLGRCIISHLSQSWICATGIRHSGEQDCFVWPLDRRTNDHPLPHRQFDRGMDRFYLDRASDDACSQTR